jgi:hypothetical protein
MQAKAIAVAAVLGVAALSWSSPPANAATCVRHSVFNDAGGHRTLIRSETRCGVAPRYVQRAPRQVTRTTTRTVVTDEYVPYTTTIVRARVAPMISERYDEIGYGASYPWPRPRYEIGY